MADIRSGHDWRESDALHDGRLALEAAGSKQAAGAVHLQMAHLKVSLPTHPILHAGLRLDVDAERAEEQELEQGGLADTLKEIVGQNHAQPALCALP